MTDELYIDFSKTYIYDDKEYMLTGRTAEKHADNSPLRPKRSRRNRHLSYNKAPDIMVEIEPVKSNDSRYQPLDKEIKWVKYSELLVVTDYNGFDEGDYEDD